MPTPSTFRRARRILLLVALALPAAAAPALAQPAEAERLIKEGLELRKQGQNLQALEYFQRSYKMFPTGRAAAQLGFVQQAVGLSLEAEKNVSTALADETDPWVRRNKTAILTALAEIRAMLGRLIVQTVPPAATVVINGVEVPNASNEEGVLVKPGTNLVEARAAGVGSQSATVTVLAGTTQRITIRLQGPGAPVRAATAPAAAAAPETATGAASPFAQPVPEPLPDSALSLGADTGSGRRMGGLVLLSAGTAAVIGGIFAMLVANHKVDEIEKDAAAQQPYNKNNGNYGTYNMASRVLYVVGGAALLGGGFMLWSGQSPDTAQREVGLAFRGSF
jgi:tetratricopeptide (TPR) repeat protein